MISQGQRLSLQGTTLGEIWNADAFYAIRSQMLAGMEVKDCQHCYATEAQGGTSLRQIMNASALPILGIEKENVILERANTMVHGQQGQSPPPTALHLWLGNFCNLKCRMCSPMFSSRIALDPVHTQWSGELTSSETLLPTYREGVTYSGFGDRLKRGQKWTRQLLLGIAKINFPTPEVSVDYLDISGWNYSHPTLTLSIKNQERELLKQCLPSGQWQTRIYPNPPWQLSDRLQLWLELQGNGHFIDIDELTIATRGHTNRGNPRPLLSRLSNTMHWSENETVIFEEILAQPEHLQWIQFSGGEPLLHRAFPIILQKLIETGNASHIKLYITSNGTVYSKKLSELLRPFASVELAFSIDGYGPLQEYIRYPSKWKIISQNIFAFVNDNLPVSIRSTPQAYNIFGLLDLADWCSQHQLPFFCENILQEPHFLSLDMLPQRIINKALKDWSKYLKSECKKENFWQFKTVIAALQRPRPKADKLRTLQKDFIRFTHDLDESRGQSFAQACPRLYESLSQSGVNFTTWCHPTGHNDA